MKTFLATLVLLVPMLVNAQNEKEKTEGAAQTVADKPIVVLQTTMGDVKIELYPEKAPLSVKNFLKYVDSGHYDGVIFHRIIDGFMVQTGGFTQNYAKKRTSAPIVNESGNGLKNVRGTLSMARTNNPDSATAQFFINLVNNSSLDFRPGRLGMPDQQGYAVFGKVLSGMETIDKMAKQPQGKHARKGHGQFKNAPNEAIVITKAVRAKK